MPEGAYHTPNMSNRGGLTALDFARVRNRQSCLVLLKDHVIHHPPLLKEVCMFMYPMHPMLLLESLMCSCPIRTRLAL